MIKRFSFKNKKQQSTRMTISSNSQNPNIETILRSQKISTTEDSAEKKKKKNKKFLKKFLKLRSASKFRSPFQSGGKGVPESSKQPDTKEKKRQKKQQRNSVRDPLDVPTRSILVPRKGVDDAFASPSTKTSSRRSTLPQEEETGFDDAYEMVLNSEDGTEQIVHGNDCGVDCNEGDWGGFLNVLLSSANDGIKELFSYETSSNKKSSKKKDPIEMHSPRHYSKSLSNTLPLEEKSDKERTFNDKAKVMYPVFKTDDDESVTSEQSLTYLESRESNPSANIQDNIISEKNAILKSASNDSGSFNSEEENKNELEIPSEELYDVTFSLNFLKELTQTGLMLEYCKVSENEEDIDNTLINMCIRPGYTKGTNFLQPKLCWSEITSSKSVSDDVIELNLLSIHSIHTSLEENGNAEGTNDDESPFFVITSESGVLYIFEAPTLSERNNVVQGLKNIVAWLSSLLISGSMTSTSYLVPDLDQKKGEQSGELPSLKTPVQVMSDLTHAFLQ